MLTDLQKNSQDLRQDLNKKSKDLQKNRVSEIKHTIEGFNSRLSQDEDIVNELGIREQENNEAEKQ